MQLEQSLNGGYNGLYGEVVTCDVYHLRDVADIVSVNDPKHVHEKGHKGIDFIPDVVIDIGANVGVFTRYARTLYPDALIVSVEPHPSNLEVFKEHTKDSNNILIEKAIGMGSLWHFSGAVNGSGEMYCSEGLGMPADLMPPEKTQLADIPTVMPDALIQEYVKPGQKLLVKMDIEGAENCVFEHAPSMEALKKADYFCLEVHFYSTTGEPDIKDRILEVLKTFEATHNCQRDHVTFYARKK